jgi:uncharacterized protein DUF11/VCBS repeat protein
VQGQTDATYTLTVHNEGPASTNGVITVVDPLPSGLMPGTANGTDWVCYYWDYTNSIYCSRSDSLPPGASYPPITMTVRVAKNAPASITNTATVSGLGDWNAANSTASDPATIYVHSAGDFDADGHSDVIWRNAATGQNAMWLLNGSTLSSPALLTTIPDPAWRIGGVGDFDGDRKDDVIWVHMSTGQVVVWLMDGTSLRSATTITILKSTDWKLAGVGDADNDMKSDVFWRNVVTGETVVWLMNGASIKKSAYLSSAVVSNPAWNIVALGDFDGNGTTDAFWRNGATGETLIWWVGGLGFPAPQFQITVADPDYKVAGTGDFNGDQTADILWWNQTSGDVVIWMMELHGPIGAYIGKVSDVNWHPEAIGDFDKDGKADIFWRNVATGQTVVWLMDGPAIKQAQYVAQVNDLNWVAIAPR